MLRWFSITVIAAIHSVAFGQHELDQPYFGLEFRSIRDAVQISWIDPNHRAAQKLKINDIVLSAGDLDFGSAAELTELLQSQAASSSVRFEVLALADKNPRKVAVRSEVLREAVPRRFNRERDRAAKEVLFVPRFPGRQFYIAVAVDYAGTTCGIRVRFYPRDSKAVPGKDLTFWAAGSSPHSRSALRLPCSPSEFIYANLTPVEVKKLPALSRAQSAVVQREAYVELGSDRTAEILDVLRLPSTKRRNVGYNRKNSIVYNRCMLTDDEIRNIKWCLMYYQILTDQ